MKNTIFRFISNLIGLKKNNEKKSSNAKFLQVYLDSVGQRFYYNYGGQYSVSNKEFHKQIWNKAVKPKTEYEIFKSTIN
jgi:hypothetical protein